MRPTTPPERAEAEPEQAEVGDDPGQVEGQGQAEGRGVAPPEPKGSTRTRRKRPPVSTVTTGRKLQLPDDVHDRLWLLARQRKTTVSAIATEILDRNLPRFKVEREG